MNIYTMISRRPFLFTFAAAATGGLLMSLGSAHAASVIGCEDLQAARGWGEVHDGLQAKLGIEGGRRCFYFGETAHFTLTLRNAGSEHVSLRLYSFRDWSVTIAPDNLLMLNPLPGASVSVRLEPGEQQEFPGASMLFRPLGTILDARYDVPLMPGRYTIRADSPFYVEDPRDSRKGAGLRAQPGPIEIEVRESRGDQPVHLLPEDRLASWTGVAWGKVAGGLQGGLAFKDGKDSFAAGDTVASRFLVRNVIDSPIGFTYRTYENFDWSPQVEDLEGRPQQVKFIDVLGWRVQKSVVLQPGEIVEIGQPVLALGVDLRSGATPGPPVLYAPPGRYVMSEGLGVTPNGSPTPLSSISLASGKLAFTITEKELEARPQR